MKKIKLLAVTIGLIVTTVFLIGCSEQQSTTSLSDFSEEEIMEYVGENIDITEYYSFSDLLGLYELDELDAQDKYADAPIDLLGIVDASMVFEDVKDEDPVYAKQLLDYMDNNFSVLSVLGQYYLDTSSNTIHSTLTDCTEYRDLDIEEIVPFRRFDLAREAARNGVCELNDNEYHYCEKCSEYWAE